MCYAEKRQPKKLQMNKNRIIKYVCVIHKKTKKRKPKGKKIMEKKTKMTDLT